ncbi:MAG: hypothetical protein M0P31_09010 [Solirubrobacteraceae bacterium]|nr:hypothetical protein [Solirubrobacteraceae bacterium]
MGLLRGKPKATVEVTPTTVVAGGTVRARASFGRADGRTRGARIELLYRNTRREDSTDADGDASTSTVTSSVKVDVHHVSMDDGDVDVELVVPADAPGTAEKTVAWQVHAVVDRRMALDTKAKADIVVLSPPGPLASWASAPAEVTVPWSMVVEPSTRVVRPGDRITGRLSITPSERVKCRAVRVQLRRLRVDPDGNRTVEVEPKVDLAGATTFTAGETVSYPFEIAVPEDAAPSFRAQHNHQHWYLEGVLDQRLSKDPRVICEIVVHTA